MKQMFFAGLAYVSVLPGFSALQKLRSVLARPRHTHHLVIATAVFVIATGNIAFFRHLLEAYPFSGNTGFVLSVAVLQICVLIIFLSLFSFPRLIKPVLILTVLSSSAIGYFQDHFGVIIDRVMIHSIFGTNFREATELMNGNLIVSVLLLGVLPSLLLYFSKIQPVTFHRALLRNTLTIGACLAVMVGTTLPFSANYASFLRQHKMVRYYTNPVAPLYALGQMAAIDIVPVAEGAEFDGTVAPIVTDARKVRGVGDPPRLIVFVLGETVRSSNLSLNGYVRETTPGLEQRDIINYANVTSCGTATAVSVPCIFSLMGHEDFSLGAAGRQENLLDVLQRVGVSVLWRENNSDSKGVALRVPFEDFRSSSKNPVCNPECRDEGMLDNLQSWIDAHQGKDMLIVLHQMGNHGPAYYKRYPAAYEVYKPTCKSDELSTCTNAEIVNAYDNAVRYTDHFLVQVIDLLESNADRYQAAMVYTSDHGESLGEHGIYLHGLPFAFAPPAQTEVPVIFWFGRGFDVDTVPVQPQHPYSHDDLFRTLLDLFRVKTDVRMASGSLISTHG